MTTRCATCTLGQCVGPSACLMIYTMGFAAGVASVSKPVDVTNAINDAYDYGYTCGQTDTRHAARVKHYHEPRVMRHSVPIVPGRQATLFVYTARLLDSVRSARWQH
jgi:hypothetical protein